MQNLKRNDTQELIYRTETDSQTQEDESRVVRREGRGEGGVGEVRDGQVHTAAFKTDTNKDLLYGTARCSMLRGSQDGRGIQGRMDTCVGTAESLCCPPQSITALLTGYTKTKAKVF